MTGNNPLITTRQLIAEAQIRFTHDCEAADQRLEARLVEAFELIQASACEIASLESSLELFDGLEQIRMAAQTRRDITAAVERHRDTVDRAKVLQRQAWQSYHGDIIAAAGKLAAAKIE